MEPNEKIHVRLFGNPAYLVVLGSNIDTDPLQKDMRWF